MRVTKEKSRRGTIFAWEFEDLEEASAFADTLRECVDNQPACYKNAKFEQVCARFITRIKKKDEERETYESYLFEETETIEFLNGIPALLSAAQCFLTLTADQLKNLYN